MINLSITSNYIEVDPNRVHGIPIIKGTRFTVAQFLAELADGNSISNLAETFDFDEEILANVLQDLSVAFGFY